MLLKRRMNVSPSEVPTILNTSLQRLAAQSASCKLWSIVLTSLVLAMAAGRVGAEVLVWAAAPVLLLSLADAAYTVQARRLVALAAKETLQAEELFGTQTGNSSFSTSVQALKGLSSFSVWPFYSLLAMMVVVLGQIVLVPQNKPQFLPQNPSINASSFQSNATRSAFSNQQNPSSLPSTAAGYPGNLNMPKLNNFAPPNGSPQFQPPPNQINVTRPNMPPMGVPTSKPQLPGTATKPSTVPGSAPPTPASLNRPAPNTFTPPPKPQPAPNATLNSSPPKPEASQTQPPK